VLRLLAILASTAALLAVASPAPTAPPRIQLVVIGRGGAAVVFHGQRYAPLNLFTGVTEERGSGDYRLLYWIVDGSYMTEPGRYFPVQRIACLSWIRSRLGDCYTLDDAPAAELTAVAVAPLRQEPTILVRLAFRRRDARLDAAGGVAIEYAFTRRGLGRRAPRPLYCTPGRAKWTGPAASVRPTRLCVATNGVWTGGRFYRVPGPRRAL
jgi:hypothetical protein